MSTWTDERLRAAGLKATRPRRLVLETLERLGGHRSADDVADALAGADERMSRQSIYNVLDDLEGVGLVQAADVGAGSLRFELAGDAHHHFLCRVCHRILDVEGPAPEVEVPGAVVDSASVLLRGVCTDCRSADAVR